MKSIQYLKENGIDVDGSIALFGDVDLYNSTMQDFLESIDNKLEKLKMFKEANEISNYAIFAHSVKSDARYLGFTTVAEIALKHEMAGKEDNSKYIKDNYEDLINLVNQMIETVKSYLYEEDTNIVYNTSVVNLKKHVLIIDDAPLITGLANRILADDYDLKIINDSKEVVNYLNENYQKIDGMLLDLNMPEVSGFDILEYMKQNNMFSHIKVSIITGDESKETIDNAFTYPIIDMLSKPFSVESLKSVVEKTIV